MKEELLLSLSEEEDEENELSTLDNSLDLDNSMELSEPESEELSPEEIGANNQEAWVVYRYDQES
jgi:hypothetical protein